MVKTRNSCIKCRPKISKKLGLKSDMTFPIEDEQKGVDYIPFNITIDDLKTLGRTQNFNVFEYDKGDYVESRKFQLFHHQNV